MENYRYSKLLATIGPASDSEEVIRKLILAGASSFRLNCSHASHSELALRCERIRKISKELGEYIPILLDLQGPKLRVGKFSSNDGVYLAAGERFTLVLDEVMGDETRVTLPHPEIFKSLEIGTTLLFDDGKMKMKVVKFDEKSAECEVEVGGVLKSRKGVNVPDVVLSISALTPKDREDLEVGLKLDVDWVALSFVQKTEDVKEIKQLIDGKARVIAKIEKPSAVTYIDEIIEATDAIMIARGDLGVECPPETVPILQRKIINKCHISGVPVIVATQMLESMIEAPTPTRAEASDVATAIYQGADAVMLSAETAAGKYPVEAVSIMSDIISSVENDEGYISLQNSNLSELNSEESISDSIASAACRMASGLKLHGIVATTTTGSTVMRVARGRVLVPLYCAATSEKLARQLNLVWGVRSFIIPVVKQFHEVTELTREYVIKSGLGKKGDHICALGSYPMGTAGITNTIRIIDI